MQLPANNINLAITVCVIILLLAGAFFLFKHFGRDKKRKELTGSESFKNIFAQTLLRSQVEIYEQILRNVARELHSNFGQVASLIKINLNTLNLSDSPKATEKLQHTLNLTRQLLTDIKLLSLSAGADGLLQKGLSKEIEAEAHRLNGINQCVVNCRLQGTMPDIETGKALILYRMAQETLNKMAMQSGAKQINVLLNVSEKLFTLVFADEGPAFDMNELLNKDETGFYSLQNRARLIGAKLSVQNSPGNGCNISIALPL